jgi:hypothetical protein
MKASIEAKSLGGSRLNPKGTRWESVGTSWSMGGDEVTSGADCTVVLGTRVKQVFCERAGVVRFLGVGVLRGDGARLRLRREVDARRAPRWGAVDSLDSRRGAASCLASVAPPPPPSVGEATGQTRKSFFRHVGKTLSIPSPAGGLSAAIVAVARRGKEYHVAAAVEGHELETPEMEHRPGLERLLETTHLELDGKLFVNTQQAPTWRANCRRFDPGRPWTDE